MTDKMRLMELCLRESAATFNWDLVGNCLSCKKGFLSFILLPSLSGQEMVFSLKYRYSAFDSIYYSITNSTVYPGYEVVNGIQPIESWTLMGVSTAMRSLVAKADRFAYELSEKIRNVDDNTDFLKYLEKRALNEKRQTRGIFPEKILSYILMGDYDLARGEVKRAKEFEDSADPFYLATERYLENK